MSQSSPVELTTSRYFLQWLHDEQISLGFTTYQTNRLFLLGLKPDGGLSTFERLLDRPMGLHATSERLYLASRYQLWRFDNTLPPGEQHEGYDRVYVPRVGHTTGDLDIHDVSLLQCDRGEKTPVFVNTLYSCLSTLSERYSFRPIWQPPFITKLAPEDRCHLNGMAMVDDQPAYVTSVSRSDVAAGWRQRRHEGGCLIDVQSDEIVLSTLSMPHSPRVYQDKVWLLNSGTGEIGYAELNQGVFEPIAFCPGYLRGLAFHDRYAIVGLSKPRENRTFSGLELDDRLQTKDTEPRCGLMVVDLDTGNIAHWLEIEGIVSELYDVQVLPGVTRPMALGFKTDEICRILTIEKDPDLRFEPLIRADADESRPIDFVALRQSTAEPALASPPSAGVQRTARPGQTATVSTVDNSAYRFQLSVDMTVAAAVQSFAHLTFPDLREQAQSHFIREPLITIVVLHQDQLVGMAMAEVAPAGDSAEIISLYLAPEHRGRRLSYGIVQHLENALRDRGCQSVSLVYGSEWPSRPAVERLLNGLSWTSPQPYDLLAQEDGAEPTDPSQTDLRTAQKSL